MHSAARSDVNSTSTRQQAGEAMRVAKF
jgi:hypothetical protein